jgi:hypothetical protein
MSLVRRGRDKIQTSQALERNEQSQAGWFRGAGQREVMNFEERRARAAFYERINCKCNENRLVRVCADDESLVPWLEPVSRYQEIVIAWSGLESYVS